MIRNTIFAELKAFEARQRAEERDYRRMAHRELVRYYDGPRVAETVRERINYYVSNGSQGYDEIYNVY